MQVVREIDLLLTDEDRKRLLCWTLEQGASIVPDLHYKEPRYSAVSTIEQINELASYRHFFVLRADWQIDDLLMRPVVNKHEGPGYYIAQRYGGPAIDYMLYPEHGEVGHTTLGRGSVAYYSHYFAIADGRKVTPPPAMKSFFSQLSQFIRTESVCLKGKKRSAWLSRSASSAVTSGNKHLPTEWLQASRPT